MPVIKTIYNLLFLKLNREDILSFQKKHLITGFIVTWVVGMGRYWDDPNAKLLQHLGFGSVIYIVFLALLIWIIIKPFQINGWSYFRVLTFISLTSFPAILYAIPVERFCTMRIATSINIWFLIIVATWRLCMLFVFLRRFTRLAPMYITSVALLPICAIIVLLSTLNLERAVFNVMGGLRQTSNDGAYFVLLLLSVISAIALIPLLITYIYGIFETRKKNSSI